MAKYELKQKVLELRKQGMSYSQIRKELKVSKGSLSLWLKDYPLSKARIRKLRDLSDIRIEKFSQTMKAKREARLVEFYNEEKSKNLPLSKKELFIAGLFLYWGEGMKNNKYPLGLYNTNPQLIKFGLYWYKNILKIPTEKIKIHLHLYSDMDVKSEMKFWSQELKFPLSGFANPQIKKSLKSAIKYKGTFGHGTSG
jgi:transcriptional regulator with XRE-family HTH domain